MKKTLFKLLVPAALIASTGINAQVSAYSFTQSMGTYGSPSAGTLVGAILQDDDVNSVTLPFPFIFNATSYTTVNVCANGYLSFNNIAGTEYTPISDNTTSNIIAPFGQDLGMGLALLGDLTAGSKTITNVSSVNGFSVGDVLFDYGSDFGGNPTVTAVSPASLVVNLSANNTQSGYTAVDMSGYIKASTSGTAPNRVFELEFSKFCTLNNAYDEVINFKLRLYETSNKIEVVYGPTIPGAGPSPSEVGLKGAGSGDYNSRLAAGNTWSTSAASSAITDACDFGPGAFPPNGLTYVWTPCAAPTLSVTQSASVICSGNQVTLTASGASTYTWSNGTNNPKLVVTPTANVGYTVSTGTQDCQSSKTVSLSVSPCTGTDLHERLELQAAVYPNPFNTSVNVNNNGAAEVSVLVTDALGKVLVSETIAGNSSKQLETGALQKGIYFMTLRSGGEMQVKKIIKE